jgi:aryl-alcohol dehydrogenase-like predicted oxidoreductase
VERVIELAGQHGVPPARVALAWLLHQPAITAPIVGASKLAHLDDAVGALDIKLSAEEVAYLEEPYVPHPLVGIVPFR